MDEYKSNSHKTKEQAQLALPEKKVEKVIEGEAKKKKRGELSKLSEVFISDEVNNVKSYILLDVLVPAIKKAISDIITNGIDMILYGESGRSRKSSTASKVSYRSYYDNENDRRRNNDSYRPRIGYYHEDVRVRNRGEAEEVIIRLEEIISTYGLASVADLYDLVGMSGNYTDNNYGWTDIRSVKVIPERDGWYVIKMPKSLPLN